MIYSTIWAPKLHSLSLSTTKLCSAASPPWVYTDFPLLSSFQTWRLSTIRMAEDNLEMGKGSVGQIWDWSKLIRPWLIKTDQSQTAGSSWGRIQTMDLWELGGKLKRVEIVSSSFAKLRYKLWSMSSQARMCCMRFCLLVQFVHLRPWELRIHGLGWKRARVGAFAREKAHLSSR